MNDNNCINLENVPNADEKCPWCGAEIYDFVDLYHVHFNGGGCGIEDECRCHECGARFVLVYHLGEAVRFDE